MRLRAALADTPVVFLNGPRQAGKTTLARQFPGRYFSFDDPITLAAAQDPLGFIGQDPEPMILDEIQKVPALAPVLKLRVDQDRRPGRYLLTGSAQAQVLPDLARELVGRMEVLELYPLSRGEIEGVRERFLDRLWGDGFSAGDRPACDWRAMLEAGGFPEALARTDAERRSAWFRSYVGNLLDRDVRDLSSIEGRTQLPRLAQLLAARSASLLNLADIGRAIEVPHSTARRYLALLERTFLVTLVPAWSRNLSQRLVKSPKLHFLDSGVLGHLCGLSPGPWLESFVAAELLKQLAAFAPLQRLFHFRTAVGREVDFVLEVPDGRVAGIEVKASATLGAHDFRGLNALAELTGDRFAGGAVLYTGTTAIRFAPRLWALPLSCLWEGDRP